MDQPNLARHWQALENGEVQCVLCPRLCKLKPGQVGVCAGRENVDGKLLATNYGQVVALNIDPIEKKPLYHFYPGSKILSVGPNGCNLRCKNCQNWQISQREHPTRYIPPQDLVEMAKHAHSVGIAFTYAEPLIWWEYIADIAPRAHKQELKIVLVSNGYINEAPLRELLPDIDAINIDIKSMNPSFYESVCSGTLTDVLRTARLAFQTGVAVEITNLVIPGLNDKDEDFSQLIDFLAALSDRIPLHFSRYFPQHEMTVGATPIERLQRAHELAIAKLKHVYIGNAEIPGANDTHCANCRAVLIRRSGYRVAMENLANGACAVCNAKAEIRQ